MSEVLSLGELVFWNSGKQRKFDFNLESVLNSENMPNLTYSLVNIDPSQHHRTLSPAISIPQSEQIAIVLVMLGYKFNDSDLDTYHQLMKDLDLFILNQKHEDPHILLADLISENDNYIIGCVNVNVDAKVLVEYVIAD